MLAITSASVPSHSSRLLNWLFGSHRSALCGCALLRSAHTVSTASVSATSRHATASVPASASLATCWSPGRDGSNSSRVVTRCNRTVPLLCVVSQRKQLDALPFCHSHQQQQQNICIPRKQQQQQQQRQQQHSQAPAFHQFFVSAPKRYGTSSCSGSSGPPDAAACRHVCRRRRAQ